MRFAEHRIPRGAPAQFRCNLAGAQAPGAQSFVRTSIRSSVQAMPPSASAAVQAQSSTHTDRHGSARVRDACDWDEDWPTTGRVRDWTYRIS